MDRKMSLSALLLLMIAAASFEHVLAGECRMAKRASHDGCALPYELGNFQGALLIYFAQHMKPKTVCRPLQQEASPSIY